MLLNGPRRPIQSPPNRRITVGSPLTMSWIYAIWHIVFMKTFSTKQVATAVGISRVTLQRWLLSGKLIEPKRLEVGGIDVRIWSASDIERVRRYKEANYRKGRGRKKKT